MANDNNFAKRLIVLYRALESVLCAIRLLNVVTVAVGEQTAAGYMPAASPTPPGLRKKSSVAQFSGRIKAE